MIVFKGLSPQLGLHPAQQHILGFAVEFMCTFRRSDDTTEIIAAILWDGDGSFWGLCMRLGLGSYSEDCCCHVALTGHIKVSSEFTLGST